MTLRIMAFSIMTSANDIEKNDVQTFSIITLKKMTFSIIALKK
jgi:hypothetical protein